MKMNQDWIKDLAYNDWRYVPLNDTVNNTTKMMHLVYDCHSIGIFVISPTQYNPKLAGPWNPNGILDKYNWTNVIIIHFVLLIINKPIPILRIFCLY
jgi:hypothetical protein